MAQKSNKKRLEAREKSDRNMNRAIVLLIGGLIAEWYLLMAYRYYGNGNSKQVDQWFNYFGVMRWIGLAVLLVGLAVAVLHRKKEWKPWAGKLGAILAACGGFFFLSSEGARHVYPTSISVMCVLVPVALVLGIIYLFYQTEFSVQATALAAALFALSLLNRSTTTLVRIFSVLMIVFMALLLVCALRLKKNGGTLTLGGRELRLFPAEMDYRLTLAVPALGIALVAIALAAGTVAFYGIWLLGILAFALAVYYTIKLM